MWTLARTPPRNGISRPLYFAFRLTRIALTSPTGQLAYGKSSRCLTLIGSRDSISCRVTSVQQAKADSYELARLARNQSGVNEQAAAESAVLA